MKTLTAGIAFLATGCATPPEQAMVARQPHTAPVRTISNFSESLRCMDDLMWRYGKREIYITANGLPDATGRIAGGTKDMLITAVSRMSSKSNAFRFVDFEPAMDDVNALYWLVGVQPEFRAPSYYIRGAITQLDD
ncbi:MAG TPA: peptidoglycan-binding protein, partial [Azospirillaceae bacterium]|nr:peptidoglycan-binding protein [Azospirillaceae bacterium]